MIKLLGALMILSVCILFCYQPISLKKQRTAILFEFTTVLRCMSSELRTSLIPLPDLLEVILERNHPYIKQCMENVLSDVRKYGAASFQESWKTNIIVFEKHLEKHEFRMLQNLGEILGRYVLDEQLSEISMIIEVLQNGYHCTKTEYKKSEKLYLGLGTTVGLGIIIFLV